MIFCIREESPGDVEAIRELNHRAFGQSLEGNIVDALRANGGVRLSLVAKLRDQIVGHIMYSPVSIGDVEGAGLGPMAVLPEFQRQRIGSILVRAGNDKLKDDGCPFIAVLGHPGFYPQFGFKPASPYGVKCEWDVPDDVFMLLILDPARMQNVAGLARYRPVFSEVS